MRRWLKRALYLFVLVLAAGLLVYAFWPAPVEVDTSMVHRGAIEAVVNEEGRTRVRDRYVISAPLAGDLMRVELRAGDRVAAGRTVVAVIQPARPRLLDARQVAEGRARVRMAEAGVEQAAGAVRRSEAEVAWALAELERLGAMAPGAVSQKERDDARFGHLVRTREAEAARWAEQVARHELEMARAALGELERSSGNAGETAPVIVHSPVDGQVLRVMQESEAPVQPGTALLEVGQVGDLEIVMDVLSREAVRIRPGQPVRLVRWGGEGALPGVVRVVEPSAFTKVSALGVEEQRVNVIADFVPDVMSGGSGAKVPSPQPSSWAPAEAGLGDGFRVDGQIIVDRREDVLRVGVGALFRHGGGWAVFVIVDGTAWLRPVVLGLRGELDAEVVEGLSENDVVVIYPSDQVRDGVSVVVR